MAGGIKGITVKIGGDTTELGRSLSEATKQSSSLQRELKGVNSLLKLDPSNVTLLKQKSDLLNQSIAQTKQKLNDLVEVQKKVDSGEIKMTEEEYRNLQREIVSTEQKLKGLTDQQKEFGSVGAQQVAQVGEKLKDVGSKVEDVGKKLSAVSAVAGSVLAGSVASAKEMDGAYDTIITKTGATGDTLEDLKEQADDLFSELPIDIADAGTAIGEVNTRFGLTGDELEDLSGEFIKFANINGTDLNSAIDSVDSIMTKFGVDSSKTGDVLGLLTKVGQDTGLSMENLQSTLMTNGATFKELGLDITGSANLLAQFETNGVDASTALTGLKKAQQNATAEGKTMSEALGETVNAIKNAGSETEALQIATELFGKKGASEMTQAIREGRFSVEDLTGSLSDYSNTVNDTYQATISPWDETKVALNNVKLAGAELGQTMLTSLQPIITSLVEKVKSITEKFRNLSPQIQRAIIIILAIVTAIGPLLIIIGKLISAVGTIMTFAPKIVSGIKLIGTGLKALWGLIMANPVVAIVVAIIAILVLLYTKCEWFRDGVNDIVSAVIDFFKNLGTNTKNIFNKIKTTITSAWDNIKSTTSNVWNNIKKTISTVFNGIKSVITSVSNAIKSTITSVWNKIKSVTTSVWNGIKTAITNPIKAVKSTVSSVVNGIKSTVTSAWNNIKKVTITAWNAIENAITSPIRTAVSTVTSMVNSIRGVVSRIFSGIKPKLHLSLPHVSVSGGKAPWGIAGKGQLPSFHVTWNKLGAIFKKPTIFDTALGYQGVGEAGPEAVAPISELMKYVQTAVDKGSISARMDRLEEVISNGFSTMSRGSQIVLDTGVLVGETIDKIDSALATNQSLRARGV